MYDIRLNSRKLVDDALSGYLGFSKQEAHDVSDLIDKMPEIDRAKFISAVDNALKPKSRKVSRNC